MTKKVIAKKAPPQEKLKPPLIPEKYQDYVFIFLIFFIVFAFFSKAIFGNGFFSPDSVASISLKTYSEQASKQGTFPLWMPYIFSGLPGYASLFVTGPRVWDIVPQIVFGILGFIGKLFNNDVARMATWYGIYGTGIYLLLRSKKMDPFVAFFAAVGAAFSTYAITWVMIGHNTKPIVFAMFPYVFFLLEKLREKFSLIYSVLLVFVIHIMMEAGHLQMIFYGICAFSLYFIFELVHSITSKGKPVRILRAAAVLALAGGIAFLMSADRYFSTMEYTPYSTRGSAPILKTDKQHQDESGGNDYQYATMWSFSPQEMMTFFVPDYFGFGKLEYKGPLTDNRPVMVPTYWGQKESEDSPPYMGILILGLGIIGFILYRKDSFVQFLFILSIFGLFLSFGKNLSILYDFFFYHVPSFNKFRAPSMALALVHFAIPILAGYGLTGIIAWRKELNPDNKKIFWGILISSFAFLFLGFMFSAAFKNSYLDAFTSSAVGTRFPQQLVDFVWSEMIGDWYMTAFIAMLAAFAMYLYVKRKIPRFVFFCALAALLIFDMWRVDFRPMEVPDRPMERTYLNKTDWINYIKQDNSQFRIAYFSSEALYPAYFLIENINGYHPAKLRVYQDLMDVVNLGDAKGSTSVVYNPFLWNLLNVKYVVAKGLIAEGLQPVFESKETDTEDQPDEQGKPPRRTLVTENPNMLPRTFFVKNAQKAPQMDILNHLKNGDFKPREIAYIEKDLPVKLDTDCTGDTSVVVTHRDEYIKIEANAKGNNLLFISEIYYPVCWFAFVDGKETEIYKTNYAFRSIIVPPGKHEIELKYISSAFNRGKTISLILNILTLIAFAGGVIIEFRKRKKR